MISGKFSSKGELVFEIALIGADGESYPIEAILDTGFTGWLAIDKQEADSLDWILDEEKETLQTAGGDTAFNIYLGTVLLDGEQFNIQVIGGDEFVSPLLGVKWLQTKRLVVDFPAKVLTLG